MSTFFSNTIWDAANGVELIGLVLGFLRVARIESHSRVVGFIGLTLHLVGISVRWAAIRTLGKFFTGVVTIQRDHRLVRHGPYRHIRPRAYTEALIAHLGLGLVFASWVSLMLNTLPFWIAAVYRMGVEERSLAEVEACRWACGLTVQTPWSSIIMWS